MALNASSVSLVIERSELTLAVLAVYADMSGTERKVERQRRGKGADRVSPEAQWSGVEINPPSLNHRESASLGCLRGETRKADKSCATVMAKYWELQKPQKAVDWLSYCITILTQ